MKMKIATLLLIFLTPVYTCADTLSIGTINKSYHAVSDDDLNENHRGLYVKYNRFTVGKYTNSYNVNSTFITYDIMCNSINDNVDFNIIAGVANNYDKFKNFNMQINGYAPMIGISVRYYFMKITITPIATVIGLEFKL